MIIHLRISIKFTKLIFEIRREKTNLSSWRAATFAMISRNRMTFDRSTGLIVNSSAYKIVNLERANLFRKYSVSYVSWRVEKSFRGWPSVLFDDWSPRRITQRWCLPLLVYVKRSHDGISLDRWSVSRSFSDKWNKPHAGQACVEWIDHFQAQVEQETCC